MNVLRHVCSTQQRLFMAVCVPPADRKITVQHSYHEMGRTGGLKPLFQPEPLQRARWSWSRADILFLIHASSQQSCFHPPAGEASWRARESTSSKVWPRWICIPASPAF